MDGLGHHRFLHAAKLALCFGLACAASGAAAADMPLRGSAPPIDELPPVAPLYSWTGLHIGVEGGWARAGKQTLITTGTTVQEQALLDEGKLGAIGFSDSGTVVGGGIGYDVQFRPGSGFVVGLAADMLAADLDRTRIAGFDFAGSKIGVEATQRLDWIGTVRGRVGYAFDRVLVYGTGGFAFGGVDMRAGTTLTNAKYDGAYDGGLYGGIATGFVYGGGVEFGIPTGPLPLGDRLSVKVEYLRYDLGDRHVAINGVGPVFGPDGLMPAGHTGDTRWRTQGQMVKAGLTYRLW